MDIKAGILSLMLLLNTFFFYTQGMLRIFLPLRTLQFFGSVDFVIIIVVVFNNGFLEYVYKNYN